MRKPSSLPALIFIVILAIGLTVAYWRMATPDYHDSGLIAGASVLIAFVVSYSVKVADQWERAVVLRLGRFRALEGPGLFFIIPIIETVALLDRHPRDHQRLQGGKDPDQGHRAGGCRCRAVLEGRRPEESGARRRRLHSAINWASQTALRDVIGKTMLSDMLEGRDKISSELQKIIDVRTEPWGINVISVEVKDVLIPPALEDAMSMQAQAERERQARVILGDSERQVAEKFVEAAKIYANNPDRIPFARHEHALRGPEAEHATIVIVPSTAIETMQLGGLAGMTALTATLGQERTAAAPGPWSAAAAPKS